MKKKLVKFIYPEHVALQVIKELGISIDSLHEMGGGFNNITEIAMHLKDGTVEIDIYVDAQSSTIEKD